MLLAALAGCGERKADTAQRAQAGAGQRGVADQQGRIMCAENGAAMKRACTVDRQTTDNGLVLTLSHPDGAFHRLLVTKDGRGVIAADGAEPAKVSVVGPDLIEVAVGHDRYQLPATVKGSA